MDYRSKILVLGLPALAAACASAGPPRPVTMASCAGLPASQTAAELYGPEKITRIEPITRTKLLARATKRTYVIGAHIFIPAEPGMNEAYLERVLSCRATSKASGHPNDPLLARGVVDVDVASVGPNMRVAIVGENREAGEAILQRARALRGESADVTIQQLSSASTTRSTL